MNDATTIVPASNWRVMRALLAKDWRFFRVPVIALLLASLVCYLIALVSLHNYRQAEGQKHEDVVAEVFFAAAIGAVNLVPLLAAVFGGSAIASERSDRTADFMALLPVTRLQIILSKWLVSIFVLALFSAVDGSVILTMQHHRILPSEAYYPICLWFSIGTSLYGVAWLFSALLKSAPISTCISIAATVILTVSAAIFVDVHQWNAEDLKSQLEPAITACCTMLLGVVALVSGTVYYLRRTAP